MAQVDAFLKLDGIKGESADSVHKGEIDVLSWNWTLTNNGSAQVGGGAGAGKVKVNDITIFKRVDTSTPTLMQCCATGKHIPTGKLTVRKAGDKPLEYFTVELTEILVSGITDQSDPGSPSLQEQITLNFVKFKVTYTPQDDKGAGGASVQVGFDITANKTM